MKYRVEYKVGATERATEVDAFAFESTADWLLATRVENDGLEVEVGRWPLSSIIQVTSVEEPRDGD